MGNPNRARSMIECLPARGQNNFLRRRKRFEFPHSLGHKRSLVGQGYRNMLLGIFAHVGAVPLN
jgi:hypothetical protein